MKINTENQPPPGGCLARLVRRLTRWAWTPGLDALAIIAPEEKPPPPGKVQMYCAGWRDMTGIGWGDYYLHSIHPTPEAATARYILEDANPEKLAEACGLPLGVITAALANILPIGAGSDR